jgi:flagellin-like protein
MKGITPIIAIMLLLMITISMIGFAFVWFTKIMDRAKNSTEDMLNNQQQNAEKKIEINSLISGGSSSTIYIRNSGTNIIKQDEISVYVAGALQTCTGLPADIGPGDVVPCTVGMSCSTFTVKVTVPGHFDERTC